VFAPTHRTCRLTDEPTQQVCSTCCHTSVCVMAGVALGIACRALHELEDMTAVEPFARSETMLREHPPSQAQTGPSGPAPGDHSGLLAVVSDGRRHTNSPDESHSAAPSRHPRRGSA
jgi:hypothetical protein